MNLFDIKGPQDIKAMNMKQLTELAATIRTFLVESVARTGGHLSSNLGIVELTIALHYVFSSPEDKLIFDVGHQSYVHKILTGRAGGFAHLRQYEGLSGFQKRRESEHDMWEAGHSSTSLSAALGIATARDLSHARYQVIAVIGDGALGGGMAMEALNQIGSEQRKMIIIFNDNNMSISENVGAMDKAFTRLRTSKPYNSLKHDLKGTLSTTKLGKNILHTMQNVKNAVKENVVDTSIFGDFNLDYIGPIDGHDLPQLIRVLRMAAKHDRPVVIHALTTKGKGYPFAEKDKDGSWHGVSPFDVRSGQPLAKLPLGHKSWSEAISSTLLDLAEDNEDIVAITPAMKGGSKLTAFFDRYPQRSFDCGIAEEHAMTFAAGLCINGKRPFISVYSSFLQRAYDQISHDVARMKLPVVIGIDRCGLVGEDGETHHGIFDIAMLRHIPHMILAQPKDGEEAQHLLYSAFQQSEYPYALRYPRGSVPYTKVSAYTYIEPGSWSVWNWDKDTKLIVVTYGEQVDRVIAKAQANTMPLAVVNARFFKPLDHAVLERLCTCEQPVFLYENDILCGGLSSAILEYANDHGFLKHFIRIGIDDHFVQHGSISQLRKAEHLDMNSLFALLASYL